MAVTETDVWVLNHIASNESVATIDAGVPGPGGDIAVGADFVWVTMIDIPLAQIDPANNKVVAQYVGKGGDAVRIGHGAAWMCSRRENSLIFDLHGTQFPLSFDTAPDSTHLALDIGQYSPNQLRGDRFKYTIEMLASFSFENQTAS
jgi:hypothetical protein